MNIQVNFHLYDRSPFPLDGDFNQNITILFPSNQSVQKKNYKYIKSNYK